MQRVTVPTWMSNLDDDELDFVKRFILNSGSLKKLAAEYEVSYPTVRLRLDRLIQKVQMNEDVQKDEYVSKIKQLAMEEKVDFDVANILITEYRKTKGSN